MAALIFGLSMVGWLTDPARVVAGAGLGRWLVAGRVRLNHAPPVVAPLLLGSLQGWLPCALVYAAASRAVVAGSAGMGVLTMVVFGLGTVPAIFALTVVPQTVLRRVKAQRLAGVLLSLLGVLLILRGLANFGLVPSTRWW
jgi:sulfite exporter TauE/SafE